MADDLSGLVALVTVADKRSFTAAAAELRVTPSAVSQAVRALEERVGVRLLARTTRSVGLTEAGERFVSRLRPALVEVHGAFEALGELRDRPAGVLRLNVPRVGYDHVLAPVLGAFHEAYPDIVLDLCVDDGLVDIVAEGFDAGIRLGETLDRAMVAVRVSSEQRIAVVASPGYLAARGTPRHPKDLVRHACIGYRPVTRGGVYRWEFTERGEDFDIAVDGPVLTNDAAVMIDAARVGVGLAYVFEDTASRDLAEGRLVRVLEPFCAPFPGYFLYYPSRVNLPPKLRALVDFLRSRGTAAKAGRSTRDRGGARASRAARPR